MLTLKIYYSQLACMELAPAVAVDQLIAAGATHVELMLDGGGWQDFHLHIDELAQALCVKPVTYAVHVPVWDANLTCENLLISQAVYESYAQTILLAAALRADHVVLHPGFCQASCFDKAAARSRAAVLIDRLLELAVPCNIPLLVENVGSNRSSLYTMEQYIDYCVTLPEGAAALVDVGHAHMNGWDFEQLFTGLGSKLEALHIHDNDGGADSHSPMGVGTVNWERLGALLRRLALKPSLILEYNIGCPLTTLTEGQEQLKQLFF